MAESEKSTNKDAGCPECGELECHFWRLLKRHKPLDEAKDLPDLDKVIEAIAGAEDLNEKRVILDAALCQALDWQFSCNMGMVGSVHRRAEGI